MSTVNSKESLISYTLRSLGAPIIQINVSPEQLEDRLTESIQWLQDYHMDFSERVFIIHELQQDEINRNYLELSDSIMSVLRVLPATTAGTTGTIFNAEYQIRWEDLKSYWKTGQGMVGYYITGTYIDTVNYMFNKEKPVRFTVANNRLYIECNWSIYRPGNKIVVEAFQRIDPEENPKLYNDPFLKKYYKAQVKRQWGDVLSKYAEIPLVGGMKLNGKAIKDEAEQEIKDLQLELQSSRERIPFFVMG